MVLWNQYVNKDGLTLYRKYKAKPEDVGFIIRLEFVADRRFLG